MGKGPGGPKREGLDSSPLVLSLAANAQQILHFRG